MTTDPDVGEPRRPAGSAPSHSRLARWAVWLAAAVAVVISVSYMILAVAYTVGGSQAISDTWVGFLGAIALIGGLPVALAACALAVVAKVRQEQWVLLWFPLWLFPTLAAIVVLVETLWLE